MRCGWRRSWTFLKARAGEREDHGSGGGAGAAIKAEFRYQFLIKAMSRKVLNGLLKRSREFAEARKWGATALVIDVDPLTLT